MVATGAGNKVLNHRSGDDLKSCKLRMRVKFNILVPTILSVSCISNLFTSWHCLLKSQSILHGYLLSTGVELGFSQLWYGVRVVQTILQAFFLSTTTGVVVQGFRSSSVPVTHEGYLVELRRPLWFGSSQANHSVFNTLSRHSPLAAVSRSTSIISLRIASLSSLFSSSRYIGSHCSAFLFC